MTSDLFVLLFASATLVAVVCLAFLTRHNLRRVKVANLRSEAARALEAAHVARIQAINAQHARDRVTGA